MIASGGIPTMHDEYHNLQGMDAVIGKDLSSELLARTAGTPVSRQLEMEYY